MQPIGILQKRVVIVTGANTGVGKTILSALLMQLAFDAQITLRVLKPFSAGGQEDAQLYANLLRTGVAVSDINPWHYIQGIAPMLAARQENARLPSLVDITTWIRSFSSGSDLTIVEGAGGVLTPLGEGYSILDVGMAVGGHFLVVVPNLLGAINQARLCYEVLVMNGVEKPTIVLMDSRVTDDSSETNLSAIRELCSQSQVIRIPYVAVRSQIDKPNLIYNLLKKSLVISELSDRTISVLCEVAGVSRCKLKISGDTE